MADVDRDGLDGFINLYELFARTYACDVLARVNQCRRYQMRGEFERALPQCLEAKAPRAG